MSTTTTAAQIRLRKAHACIRHNSTVDAADLVREQNRHVELAAKRQATNNSTSSGKR